MAGKVDFRQMNFGQRQVAFPIGRSPEGYMPILTDMALNIAPRSAHYATSSECPIYADLQP